MAIQLAEKRAERFEEQDNSITESQVAEYLLQNPNFFKSHENVLVEMDLSSTMAGNVTSIYDFQLRKVRRKMENLEDKNRTLVQTTLQNMQTENQIHELVVHLMKAQTMDDLFAVLQGELKMDLSLDFIKLMPSKGSVIENDDALDTNYIDSFFNTQTNVQLRTLCEGVDVSMYGEQSHMESDALLRLRTDSMGTVGLLVMSSENRARFHAGQASDLLEFVAQVLGLCLERLSK